MPPSPASSSASAPAGPDPATPASRLDWIDALRGYAIFGVMVFHVSHEMPYLGGIPGLLVGHGSSGVQLFFMVSAFTIFHTLEQARTRGPISWRAFFIRRALRILPLFYLVLVMETALRLASGRTFPWAEFFSTLTFTSAWIPPLYQTMVPGGWSIAVEMSFYALAPLLFRLVRTLPRALLFAFAAVALRAVLNESLARAVANPPRLFEAYLYFWPLNQMPLFALGIVAYHAWRLRVCPRPAIQSNRDATETQILSAVLLLSSIYLATALVQGFKALLPILVLTGLALLFLMFHLMTAPGSLVANRAMAALGRVSYSAYITHFFVLRWSAPAFLEATAAWPLSPILRFTVLLAWTVALTWIAAVVLHHAVERPGQALGRKWAKRFQAA